jgi:ABC-type multidrug transport system fused ATPase/permease subunit
LRDNIAIGAPEHADDEDRIQRAAQLGGIDEAINKLPENFETYLNRPVSDVYQNLPPGTKKLFGRDIKHVGSRHATSVLDNTNTWLSGGQMQRLAV